eukprot:1979949-Pleurochrysis_carterae.AAC.1
MDEFINRYPELELKTEMREVSSLTQSRQKVVLFKLILKGDCRQCCLRASFSSSTSNAWPIGVLPRMAVAVHSLRSFRVFSGE